MMLRVGLTGNIGSGKSTVAHIFEILGVPVFHADMEAKKILYQAEILPLLLHEFGSDILRDNVLDRSALAKIVFNNKDALDKLNAIIHPRIGKQVSQWFSAQAHHPLAIEEAAIIFESGIQHNFDKIITVSSPVSLRIKRIMNRDRVSEEEVLSRMANQWSAEKKEELADYVITNDEHHLLIPQVLSIWKELKIQN